MAKPIPARQCLTGIPLVREVGLQLNYNFRVEDGARAVMVAPQNQDGLRIEIQDTDETARFIGIAKDGTMTTTAIYGGERGAASSQKLFSDTAVARAYAFIVGNQKACKSK